jgi:hypothetical protein
LIQGGGDKESIMLESPTNIMINKGSNVGFGQEAAAMMPKILDTLNRSDLYKSIE